MIRRAIGVGLAGGALISLAGIYPLIGLFAPALIPGWETPVSSELVHSLLLMASAVVAVPVFFLGGAWAVPPRPSKGWQQGALTGLLAGATAGSGCYITLVSPLNTLAAFGHITPLLQSLAAPGPMPREALLNYVATFDNLAYSVELTIGFFALVWGLAGLLAGWRRGDHPAPERPTLLSLVTSGYHPRRWFAGDESALITGLSAGVAIGLLALITTFGWFYAGFAQDLPEFRVVISESRTGMITGPVTRALGVLSPLLVLTILSFGFVVVALVKNPRDRVVARTRSILLAAVIIMVFLSAVGLRVFYFNAGLSPLLLSQAPARQNPEGLWQVFLQVRGLLDAFAMPAVLVTSTLVLAWTALLGALVGGLLLGSVQAVLAVGLVPLVFKKPVDRAVALQRKIERQPEQVLPILHACKANRQEVYDILVHLAIRTYKPLPALAQLAAALHTLGYEHEKGEHIEAVGALERNLSAHSNWRWSAPYALVYRTLHDVMVARNLEQVLLIQPPQEQHTSSLPPPMVQSMQHLNRIIGELKKITKVDDLSTRLIFLENALAAIHETRRYAPEALDQERGAAVSLPLRIALLDALDHLQGVVLGATKRLKGRADLTSGLQNQIGSHCSPLPLIWEVQNRGLNVAQEVRFRLLPSPDYQVADGEVEIEILPPGEERQVTLAVFPQNHLRRLRVEWEILYDDAVVDDRRLTFADVLEFTEVQEPFRRVFPIPYVTGTPLKTDDVFVGREDVFSFIRENLLGAHQNNVIILHGQRRTGKTSVLYRLGRTMSGTHIGVLIDMQGKPARSEADFLYSIADDIVFALEDAHKPVELPPRSAFAEAPEFFFKSRFLRSIYPHLGDRNLLLMFDEFEELQRRVEDGRLEPGIFHFLRNLMQHEDKIDFVFSGTHRLEDLSAGYWSILFNIAAYKPITFLEPGEVRRLITEPVREFGIEYDPLAVDRITRVTAGHPYFTQLVLHEMMVYHNETERNYLTAADVEMGLERILERGQAHFKHIWAESTAEERAALTSLAELSTGGDAVTAQELRRLLEERGQHSPDQWQQALDALVGREILTRRNARSNAYRFKVDLIRLWIERTRPAL